MNIRGSRPILTRRQAKQEPDSDKDDVKGVKKEGSNEESPGWLRSAGNLLPFSKSSGKDKPVAGKGDTEKDKDVSSPATSWWPQLRRKSAPEAEEKSSSSFDSRRPSQAKVSPPPSADRASAAMGCTLNDAFNNRFDVCCNRNRFDIDGGYDNRFDIRCGPSSYYCYCSCRRFNIYGGYDNRFDVLRRGRIGHCPSSSYCYWCCSGFDIDGGYINRFDGGRYFSYCSSCF
jgi:hypothetical protein